MIITNKQNLPKALVDVIEKDLYKPKNDTYSVTTLLNPTRQIILTQRHYDEIEMDANEMMNMLLGTAVHSLIEKIDKTGFSELYLKKDKLTGKCDLYDKENYELIDYKTATTWKITYKDFEDWRKQGLMYAWLLTQKGYYVKKLKFHAILKDWSPREARKNNDYPQSQVYTWEYLVTPQELKDIEDFIKDKIDRLEYCKKISDDELPDCGKEDCWYTGDKWAVYKHLNDKKAQKICDNEKEANDYIKNKMNGAGWLEFRQGEYRRCQDYCNVCKWCKYYEERKAK